MSDPLFNEADPWANGLDSDGRAPWANGNDDNSNDAWDRFKGAGGKAESKGGSREKKRGEKSNRKGDKAGGKADGNRKGDKAGEKSGGKGRPKKQNEKMTNWFEETRASPVATSSAAASPSSGIGRGRGCLKPSWMKDEEYEQQPALQTPIVSNGLASSSQNPGPSPPPPPTRPQVAQAAPRFDQIALRFGVHVSAVENIITVCPQDLAPSARHAGCPVEYVLLQEMQGPNFLRASYGQLVLGIYSTLRQGETYIWAVTHCETIPKFGWLPAASIQPAGYYEFVISLKLRVGDPNRKDLGVLRGIAKDGIGVAIVKVKPHGLMGEWNDRCRSNPRCIILNGDRITCAHNKVAPDEIMKLLKLVDEGEFHEDTILRLRISRVAKVPLNSTSQEPRERSPPEAFPGTPIQQMPQQTNSSAYDPWDWEAPNSYQNHGTPSTQVGEDSWHMPNSSHTTMSSQVHEAPRQNHSSSQDPLTVDPWANAAHQKGPESSTQYDADDPWTVIDDEPEVESQRILAAAPGNEEILSSDESIEEPNIPPLSAESGGFVDEEPPLPPPTRPPPDRMPPPPSIPPPASAAPSSNGVPTRGMVSAAFFEQSDAYQLRSKVDDEESSEEDFQ